MKLKKIVVVGPESTGKTVLSQQLAAHFNTNWVPEYAREYLLKNGTGYTFENLYEIAIGQIENEDKIAQLTAIQQSSMAFRNTKPLFIDTDLYVMKVWSEFVFDRCDNRILNGIVNREYDLYLLCKTDLPWVKDELREYPDLASREKLFHYYKDAMINQSVPWVEINGGYEERLKKAIDAVENYFGKVQ